MAIRNELIEELLAGREPQEVFSQDTPLWMLACTSDSIAASRADACRAPP
jgi:hypothetical protein